MKPYHAVAQTQTGCDEPITWIERRAETRAWESEKRAYRLKVATPAWSERKEIRALYAKAKQLTLTTGIKHDVDHIIPIANDKVCGLHVLSNLRIVTRSANAKKYSKFLGGDIVAFLRSEGYVVSSGIRALKRSFAVGRPFKVTAQQGHLVISQNHGELAMTLIPHDGEIGVASVSKFPESQGL